MDAYPFSAEIYASLVSQGMGAGLDSDAVVAEVDAMFTGPAELFVAETKSTETV